MLVQPTHKQLLRQLRQNKSNDSQRKRRRTGLATTASLTAQSESRLNDAGKSSDELEDVELEETSPKRATELCTSGTKAPVEDYVNSDDFDDFDDLEDVDLDQMFDTKESTPGNSENTLTITLRVPEEAENTKGKRKRAFTPISKEERVNRKLMHKLLLMSLMAHGAVRNRWCSDKKLMEMLRGTFPRQVVLMLHQDSESTLDYVKARKFIDGLRTMMLVFAKKFKVTFSGLARPDWRPLDFNDVAGQATERAISLGRFRRLVRAFQGSKDIQAQGLVALLRAIEVDARLVFSVQVPDYKSLRPAVEEASNAGKEKKVEPSKIASEFDPVFIPNGRLEVLSGIRANSSADSSKVNRALFTSKFPVFWVEVWNKYSKKWITVDPAVFKVVEVQPMRRKGKFEAPVADESHQTWYVLAYDRRGVVRDVTRRYTQYYNAKTVKKRIGFDSDDEQHWYEQALRAISRKNAAVNQAEAYEMKEFRDRHVCEGIPNNIADFKNHPVYALESQLRKDQVIYPNDETSKCGTFRLSNKSEAVSVYKRSHVYSLKTPKAWHMRGRVLKMGVRPLKTKPLKSGGVYAEESADLDEEVRLYAEFQTQLFRPPPIVDGKIEKNVYGNVEIFTPTMMPENGYLARVSPTVTMKMFESAAKHVLKIDYAKAIVSFDFGNTSKSKRAPTAMEGGILVDEQYKDALDAVIDALRAEQEEAKRNEREVMALKYWNFFLKKLQIMRRLDEQHGLLESDDEPEQPVNTHRSAKSMVRSKSESPDSDNHDSHDDFSRSDSEQDGYYSIASSDENSGNGEYVPRPTRRRNRNLNDDESGDQNEGSGFFPETTAERHSDSASDDGGGFLLDDKPETENANGSGSEDAKGDDDESL